MSEHSVNKKNKEWKDMPKKEKRETIATIGTIGIFILFWATEGFMFATGMVLVTWSIYYVVKTLKNKDQRKKNTSIAIILFFMAIFIIPEQQPANTTLVMDSESNQQSTSNEAERIEIESKLETERLANEKKIAEEQERRSKERLAQQFEPIGELYVVTSVIDGDTIKVKIDGSIETVRFIGMDTPETKDPRKPVQCFGREATSKMQSYAQSNSVRLEADSSQGDRDKYGRLLRYVYAENGENIAYEMIKGGYAHEYTYNMPYKYQEQFKAAYRSAREANAGLWASSTCNGDTNQTITQTAPQPITPTPTPSNNCDPNYSPCIPNVSYDLDCGDISVSVRVIGLDRHRFDRDGDGYGCESN